MKPAPFDYHAPATLAEAVRLLQQYEDDGIDAKVLAGGQSLMPMLALRVARPEVLIDLRQVAGLTGIREDAGTIVIGAMEPKQLAAESPLVQQKQPLFHAATELVGHRQIRNRGPWAGPLPMPIRPPSIRLWPWCWTWNSRPWVRGASGAFRRKSSS
ncbi:protein of unknown function [Denitratisoma oestradiolicum]|uniref:FAD-binding PCMH-type domain-containing protein n=1 Tax=Denitratisoma oestradiolicum TaxID=311182 RepID=A0A6S6Y9K0_9PROT|nr:protein of unknown function [Denitratisoma oestradiolicum]